MSSITCLSSTRAAILQQYPMASNNSVLWRALEHLLLTGRADKSTGSTVVDRSSLEFIAGHKIWGTSTRKGAFKSGKQVLEYVKLHMLPGLTWSNYSQSKYCRRVLTDGLNANLKAVVAHDLSSPITGKSGRVYAQSGSKYSAAKQKNFRHALEQEARAHAARSPASTCTYLLQRLNDSGLRPVNGYTNLLKNISAAHNVVNSYQPSRSSLSPIQTNSYRDYLRRLLRQIEDMPIPFYQPSQRGRTDRVFGLNPSILSLPSSVRLALTKPEKWVELDLTSAHLAIGSTLWQIPSIASLLHSGRSIWHEFVVQLGCPILNGNDDLKGALKKATYSAMYGMSERNIKANFTRAMNQGGFQLSGKDLMATKIMTDLMASRSAAFSLLKQKGSMNTPTGIRAVLGTGRNEGSVWSTVVNSYEAVMMKKILEYEEKEIKAARLGGRQPDFRIMLWQHDGCSIRFSKGKRLHINNLKAAVATVATHYKIPTSLEVK